MNFIDIHCHILPGIDDGSPSVDESVRMIRVACDDGISHLFATPHIMPGTYDNQREGIHAAVALLKGHVDCDITILPGADVRVTPDLIRAIEEGRVATLNDSRYLLIEFPDYNVPPHVDNLIHNMKVRRYVPILTHPERHFVLMGDMKQLADLRDSGAGVQVTALSVTGGFGSAVQKSAYTMFKKGLVDFVASDAHNSKRRPPVLSKAYAEVKREFGSATADRVFIENPGRVLDGSMFKVQS